ncbi:MAG: hypothetical protein ACYDC3_19515 [Candidatus Binataceae bacterium]
MARKLSRRIVTCMVAAFVMIGATLVALRPAAAEDFFSDTYPGFFTLQDPGRVDVIGFGGGYASDKYATTQEGFQLEQSITPYIAGVARMTGYQLFEGRGFDNPLAPGTGHEARLNFGRAQGGADFTIYPGTHIYVLGGKDFGDSKATDIEGDISSWLFLHSEHPVNFSSSTVYNYENDVTSMTVDVQAIVASTEHWIFMAGGGGAIYMGGFLPGTEGEGGPDLGVYYRPWQVGFSAQAGYGSAHQYGQLSFYKQLSFFE